MKSELKQNRYHEERRRMKEAHKRCQSVDILVTASRESRERYTGIEEWTPLGPFSSL
jgi:hypothetical protein